MAAIDTKIGVCGENQGIGQGFGHPHEAGIGETDGQVHVFPHESKDGLQVVVQVESGNQRLPAEQLAEFVRSARSDKVKASDKTASHEYASDHSPWISSIASVLC